MLAGLRRCGFVLHVDAAFDVATDVPWADLENRVMRQASAWTPLQFEGEFAGPDGGRVLRFECDAVQR